MPRQRRNINRRNAVLDGANVPAEPTDYIAMSTEALRLMLGVRHLQQTGNRCELISRLQQTEQQRPPGFIMMCNLEKCLIRSAKRQLLQAMFVND